MVARTPAKNGLSLDGLKQSVMEMVAPRDKDFITELVSIPRRYHRGLLSEKAPFLQDITRRTNCIFQFPNKETASDIVVIFGPESKIHLAASNMLVCALHFSCEENFQLMLCAPVSNIYLSKESSDCHTALRWRNSCSAIPSLLYWSRFAATSRSTFCHLLIAQEAETTLFCSSCSRAVTRMFWEWRKTHSSTSWSPTT